MIIFNQLKKYNAPILLNPGAILNGRAEDELKRLGVKQIFIVGGSTVVNEINRVGRSRDN